MSPLLREVYMSTCKLVKLGLTTAMLILAPAVSDATDAARAQAYGYPPPPRIPLFYYWTGFYGGGHLGVGWSDGDGSSGFLGGGQAGYNYQINQWVLGVEGQFSWTSIKNSVNATFVFPGAIATAHADATLDWVSTLAPRLGFAFDRWLVYGKVGGAWGHANTNLSASVISPGVAGGIAGSVSQTASGWMLGVGTEYALRDNWTAKIEYNMIDFSNDSLFSSDKFHVFKGGINYRIGGPGGPF
jgi:outer membrane immunogenic protein